MTHVLVSAEFVLLMAVGPVLTVAMYCWWRRTGHCAFWILALACLLHWLPSLIQFAYVNLALSGLSESDIPARTANLAMNWISTRMVFDVAALLLAFVGSVGLIYWRHVGPTASQTVVRKSETKD
jgi:hypothetical protein